MWAKFDITGFKYGEKNKIDVSYVTSVIAPTGKVLWTQPEPAVERSESFYPKRYVPAAMGINLQKTIRPGEYTIAVQVKDGVGGQKYEAKFLHGGVETWSSSERILSLSSTSCAWRAAAKRRGSRAARARASRTAARGCGDAGARRAHLRRQHRRRRQCRDLARARGDGKLQHNLVTLSGLRDREPLPADVVRAAMLLRIATFVTGTSAVRNELVDALAMLLNRGVTPVVPRYGSVGASGDLMPSAYIARALVGQGEANSRASGCLPLEALPPRA